MHRESGVHTRRPWKRFVPAMLLTLAVGAGGCGGAEVESGSPGSPPFDTSDEESGPIAPLSPSPTPTPGVPPPPEEQLRASSWFHRLGGPQDDSGMGLAVDGSGNVSMVWLSTPREDEEREPVPDQRLAISLARYAPDGQVRWKREFPRYRVSSPRVEASPQGEVFLSGNAFLYSVDFGLGEASDGFLVKFSGEGQALWQRRAGQKVYGTAADAEGGVLVAAEEWTPDGHVPVLAHHDAQGAFLWTRQLDRVGEGTELHALALLPSGQALLAGRLVGALTVDGHAFGAAGEQGLVLLCFEKDGSLAWGKELRGVDVHVTGVRPGAAGDVVLVGEFRGALPWGETRLSGPGAFVLAAGPEGAERWAHPLSCGTLSAPPGVSVDGEGQVAAVCGGTLSTYAPEGAQRDQRTLPPGECPGEDCSVVGTALGFVPGQGLALAGYQRYGGAGVAWDQEAFLRLIAP